MQWLAPLEERSGGQPLIIQADMARFRREVGQIEARDLVTGLRELAG